MKITVIGAGYVGLIQSVCLADFGFKITCVEKDFGKLEMLILFGKFQWIGVKIPLLINFSLIFDRISFQWKNYFRKCQGYWWRYN